jgi:hypothetical protein
MTVPVEWTDGMIHIIGTDHYFQVSTTVKRRGAAKQEMAKFQRYLSTAAKRLGAAMIAEEASAEWVKDHGPGAISVARRVAAQMRIRHRYCDPDRGERRTCGLKVGGELWDKANAISMETRRDVVAVWREEVRKGFQAREDFWLGRLKVRGLDKVAVIFVCGADHVDTFKATLGANGIQACIHCRDWPNDMSGDSSGEALSHR